MNFVSKFLLITLPILICGSVAWFALPSQIDIQQSADRLSINIEKTKLGSDTDSISLTGNEFELSIPATNTVLPPHVAKIAVALEDRRFHERGVWYLVARFSQAAINCVVRKMNPKQSHLKCQGNSTITQQLVRMLFDRQHRTPRRKVFELFLAIKMELTFSKDEILRMYLDHVHMEFGLYGVEMAARHYFGRTASQLNLKQSILIVSLFRGGFHPGLNPRAWVDRGNWIIEELGLSTQTRRLKITGKDLEKISGLKLESSYIGHFWHWLRPSIAQALAEAPVGKYKVWTTLDLLSQASAQRRLDLAASTATQPGIQGAVVIANSSGEIQAMVGGTGSRLDAARVNRTSNKHCRPPASTLKIVALALAFENGASADTIMSGRIYRSPEGVVIRNHDGSDLPEVSLRYATVNSLNTPFIHLVNQHSYQNWRALLDRMTASTQDIPHEIGTVIGQSGMCLLDLAMLYSVVANGGYETKPIAIRSIYNAQGSQVYTSPSRLKYLLTRKRILSRKVVYRVDELLQAVVREGPASNEVRRGLDNDIQVAGKTGTTDDSLDALFVGYARDQVIAVWLGFDRPRKMLGVYGGGLPAQVFNLILRDELNRQ